MAQYKEKPCTAAACDFSFVNNSLAFLPLFTFGVNSFQDKTRGELYIFEYRVTEDLFVRKLVLYHDSQNHLPFIKFVYNLCEEINITCNIITSNDVFKNGFTVIIEDNKPSVNLLKGVSICPDTTFWILSYPWHYQKEEDIDYHNTEQNAQLIALLSGVYSQINVVDMSNPVWSANNLSQIHWCCQNTAGLCFPLTLLTKNNNPEWAIWTSYYEKKSDDNVPEYQFRLNNPEESILIINCGREHLGISLLNNDLVKYDEFLAIISAVSDLTGCKYFELLVTRDNGKWYLFDLRIFPYYITSFIDLKEIKQILKKMILQAI